MRTVLLTFAFAALVARGEDPVTGIEGGKPSAKRGEPGVLQRPVWLAGERRAIDAAGPDGGKHSVARESLMLLKNTFPYQPPATPEPEVKLEASGEVVKLEPFVVVESTAQREFRKKMESDAQKIKDEQFSLRRGGAFYKNDRYEVGAWGDSPDLKLFADDAKFTDKKPVPKIGLLHIRF